MWRCKVSKDDDFSRRRTRVVECPSGIDVSGVNALSVAEFLSTVTQQQTGWRDLKVSWSIHHSRFNCEGYRDVERAWKNLTSPCRSCLMPQCVSVLALPKHVPPIVKGIWTWNDKEHKLAQASKQIDELDWQQTPRCLGLEESLLKPRWLSSEVPCREDRKSWMKQDEAAIWYKYN